MSIVFLNFGFFNIALKVATEGRIRMFSVYRCNMSTWLPFSIDWKVTGDYSFINFVISANTIARIIELSNVFSVE